MKNTNYVILSYASFSTPLLFTVISLGVQNSTVGKRQGKTTHRHHKLLCTNE